MNENESILDLRTDVMDIKDSTNNIGKMLAMLTEKEFYEKGLAESVSKSITDSINSAIEKMAQAEQGKEYFDKSLGETIKGTLSEVLVGVAKLSAPKIDMTPLLEIAESINTQQRGILAMVSIISQHPENEAEYNELLSETLSMIAKTNDFLERGFNRDYSNHLKDIGVAIGKRVREWEIKSIRDSDGNWVSRAVAIKY